MSVRSTFLGTPRPLSCGDRSTCRRRAPVSCVLLACACGLLAMPAAAQSADAPVEVADGLGATGAPAVPESRQSDRFYLQTSVYTKHFNSDDDHNNSQKLAYAEWRLPYRWLEGQVLVGGAYFDNSYDQPSQFVFAGLLWRPAESVPELYLKVAAGVVHGYKGEYQDKIPFNGSGYAPAIVPAVGYCYRRLCSELVVFGTAGAMVTLGVTLP
ncbi:MAG: hypothetical protein AW08_02421 [Candidatus Accumulibacter adjunctus]|uniref:Sn-glycerol-3-phosphate transporter n=1 Tax=Candidatus Accumulibacter adjunctus TaxID=1454001 RepID=A0A011PKL5_9PROT|nr:MAG: hypothetical protein AW08_02421 [Candidatus Accumulibacter adjunctus]